MVSLKINNIPHFLEQPPFFIKPSLFTRTIHFWENFENSHLVLLLLLFSFEDVNAAWVSTANAANLSTHTCLKSIYNYGQRNYAKLYKTRKLWCPILSNFWPLLVLFYFWKGYWATISGMHPHNFEIFFKLLSLG